MADPPAFIRAVAAAREGKGALAAGTIGHALDSWQRSPEFRGLAPRTQANRLRYIKALAAIAEKPLAGIRRAQILELRDRIAEQNGPAAANMLVQSISSLLSWSVDRGLLEFNPALRIRNLPGKHFPAWSEAEAKIALEQFGDCVRRAVLVAYHTGLRRGDLIALRWSAYDAARRRLIVMPEKTGRAREAKGLPPLVLPVHDDLAVELDQWRAATSSTHILTGPSGRPWTRENLSNHVLRAVRAAGLRQGLNLHGFRKLAATRLAEAGASTHEIRAALGWESLGHVELYTRGAEQMRLAEAAVVRLSDARQKLAKPKK